MDAKKEAYRRFLAGEPFSRIAKDTGVSRTTLQRWKKGMKPIGIEAKERQKPDFVLPELPEDGRTAEEIIESRKKVFSRKRDYYDSRSLIDIKVNLDGPIAIAHFGDPHLDSDGCDLDLFQHHMEIVRSTEGMFAGCVGDFTNNWVGRLTAQYADQTTTLNESWKLAAWLLDYMPWLYLIAGNHDLFHEGRDPMKFLTKNLGQPYIPHGVRLRLNFPNKTNVIMNLAHDYTGHSMWHSTHGAVKKAWKYGSTDSLFVHGHKHHTGLSLYVDPSTQNCCWLIRADSYKQYDDYPRKLGIDETFVSPCVTTIINPYWTSNRDKILVFLDPEMAAEVLTHLRKKWKNEHGKLPCKPTKKTRRR